MSVWSKKSKAENAKVIANAPPCKCETCKTGKVHMDNIRARDKHKITYIELKKRETELGAKYFACMFNGISGNKAWAMQKLRADFRSLDHYEKCD